MLPYKTYEDFDEILPELHEGERFTREEWKDREAGYIHLE